MPNESRPAESASDESTEGRFSIDELATLTGVTPRTVRYYVAQGLLEPPAGAKRGAHYLRTHLEQLLQIRRWSDAGLSLDRIREMQAGASQDPPLRRVTPGSVEVWSRVTVTDGLEVQLEPGRAGLSPEQVRAFVRALTALYRQIRDEDQPAAPTGPQEQG